MAYRKHKNRGGHNKIDLVNRVFGKLTVLKDTGKRKSKRPIWLCKCECGKEVEILGKYLLVGDTKSCGCITKGNAHNRTGFKTVGGTYISHVKGNAVRRGMPFEITPEDMYDQYQKQDGKCAITKIPLVMVENYRDQSINQTASLDRIDNSKGYIKGNIQWTHKWINVMRNKLSIEEFLYWCKLVVLGLEGEGCESQEVHNQQIS